MSARENQGPKQRTLTQLQPGSIIEWVDDRGGEFAKWNRRWRVHGIHIGAMGQESVICIEAVDYTPAWDEIYLPLMWVPEVLIRQCRIAGFDHDWTEKIHKEPP